jgi:hypothetical protein
MAESNKGKNCRSNVWEFFTRQKTTDNNIIGILNANVLDWWKFNHHHLPKLLRIARALLAIPATSVNLERLKSTSGNIVTRRRCNLLSEHLAELTFIHESL